MRLFVLHFFFLDALSVKLRYFSLSYLISINHNLHYDVIHFDRKDHFLLMNYITICDRTSVTHQHNNSCKYDS